MTALFYCNGDTNGDMLLAMRAAMPNLNIRVWPDDTIDKADIDIAIVWQPPASFFDGLNNLKYIYSISAGVDYLLKHPDIETHVRIVRLFDAGMGNRMANYVLYGALHAQRCMPALSVAQRNKQWLHDISIPDPDMITVGILGAGALGQVVAKHLLSNNFNVSTWSRTDRASAGKHYVGNAELKAFLGTTDVLVCLLPLTENTSGILDGDLFAALPDNAFVINPGRGDHLVSDDLVAAIDSGKLSGAMLDVFATEPLPTDSPLWQHERIIITPHIAADSTHQGSAEQIAQSMQDVEAGIAPKGLVDRSRGY